MDFALNSLIGLMLERKHEQQRVPAVIRKAANNSNWQNQLV